MLPQKEETTSPSYSQAFITAFAVWALLLGAQHLWSGSRFEPDTYSHILYWQQVEAGEPGKVTPTITPPKPLAIVIQGLCWQHWGEAQGVRRAWITVASIMTFLVFMTAHRIYSRAAGYLGVGLFLIGADTLAMVFEARASLLVALGLVFCLERVSARRCFSWGASLGLIGAGLVRPEPWLIGLFLIGASMVARMRKSSEPSVKVGPAFLTLLAPALWMAFDALAFNDAKLSWSIHSTWKDLLGRSAVDLTSTSGILECTRWLDEAIEGVGFGFVLTFLVGAWLARGRKFKPFAWLPLVMLIWVLGALGWRGLGFEGGAGILSPLWACLWIFVGGVFAAAFALVPFREAPARKTYLTVMTLLLLGKGAMDLGDLEGVAVRMNRPTDSMIEAIRTHEQERKPHAGRWLIDNDIASRVTLEARLDPRRVKTLQAVSLGELRPELWDGIVVDDRLYPRERGTPEEGALKGLLERFDHLKSGPGYSVSTRPSPSK